MTVISGGSHPLDELRLRVAHSGDLWIGVSADEAAELVDAFDRLTSELAEANDRAEAANNLHANAEHLLTEARRERDEFARQAREWRARCERWNQDWNQLRKQRDEIDELNESMRAERVQLEQLCRDNDVWLHRDQVLEILNGEGEMVEPCQPIGCDNGHHLPGCTFAAVDAELDPVREAAEAVRLDAQLAEVERRVAADKRVLDAAEALLDIERRRSPATEDSSIWLEAHAAALGELLTAVALVEAEATPQDHAPQDGCCPFPDRDVKVCTGCLAPWPCVAVQHLSNRELFAVIKAHEAMYAEPAAQGPYRVGRHQAHNIYRVTEQHPEGVQIGCMFDPADGPLVVAALNATAAVDRDGEVA